MKKILIVLVIAAAVIVFWKVIKKDADLTGPASTPIITPTPTQAPTQEGNTVVYTDAGYSPATLTVKKGQTVIWKNESSRMMWTASAVHPTHSAYPTTGGCIGSTFDACAGIVSGGTWSFKFDIAGTWKYHNHSNPSHFGTIVVE